MQQESGEDGFTTVIPYPNRRKATTDSVATFGGTKGSVRLPEQCLMKGRADWQINGGSTLRLRASEDGLYLMNRVGRGTAQINSMGLFRVLGRKLSGHYPITKIDECDIYIDISEGAS